jgi:putative flavoprotein involved in K+ transport
MEFDAVVVGGGPAGLGAAAEVSRRGLRAVVLERAAPGASWRARYDGLRLNSGRIASGVRGVPIPRSAGRFPTRDVYADYLAGCVERLGLDVRAGVEATRVDRVDGGYVVRSSEGDLRGRCVVVATGYDRVPHVPSWPGRESFAGELLHAHEYRNPKPFAGRDVLVVGTGNSGTEIAAELASGGARSVRVAMRTPGNLLPRQVLGIPTNLFGVVARHQPAAVTDAVARLLQRLAWGDLSLYGLPPAPYGVGTELERKGLGPVVDGGFVDALRAGRVTLVAALAGFEGEEVVLADGTRLRPDVVVAATGYRHGLEPLVGHLGVLDESGRPTRIDGTADPAAPGLFFNGYWLPLPGQLTGMRITSRRIGREVARAAAAARALDRGTRRRGWSRTRGAVAT